MLFFWVLGNYAERMFGNLTFWFFMALAVSAEVFASLLWDPARVSLGASGAILGVAGATVMFLVLQKPQILRAAQNQISQLCCCILVTIWPWIGAKWR